MEPLRSAAAGEWLKPLLDSPWHNMHAVVPHGFSAYARIFHQAWRDRPEDTRTWHGHDLPAQGAIEHQRVGWSAVAQAFAKHMHPLAQFHRLKGPETPRLGPLDADGWRYTDPDTGNLGVPVLSAVAAHLCARTATPDQGVTGIWDGYGGLTSASGYAEVTFTDDGGWQDSSSGATQSSEPGSGLIPADVVSAGTLDLPGRCYYLFDTPPEIYTGADWVNHAPWHHSPTRPQSPNLLWPADHAWVLVTEIDFDSTVVGGSAELIAAIVQDPNIEALVLPAGADLTWDADQPNRPVV
ncbi:hypothetical protein ACX80D_01800 [Arthrobacter sp. Sr24]